MEEYHDEYDDKAWTTTTGFQTVQRVTTKVPPGFDGNGSCFACEDLVNEWYEITKLKRPSTE